MPHMDAKLGVSMRPSSFLFVDIVVVVIIIHSNKINCRPSSLSSIEFNFSFIILDPVDMILSSLNELLDSFMRIFIPFRAREK